MHVHPPARHAIRGPQANRRASHHAADAELGPQGLPPPQGQQRVQAGPGGGEARAGGWVARQVEVGREEERWSEEREGEGLEGARVQGGDEGCEEGGGKG